MLRSVTELEKYTIGATDGTIGSVKDCYFDDETWVIRYLVIETGAWLMGRDVLISPFSIGEPDDEGRLLPVSITKDQVRNSPSVDILSRFTSTWTNRLSQMERLPPLRLPG